MSDNKTRMFLPYKVTTTSKKEIEFKFHLDINTESPLFINETVNIILSKISSEIDIANPSNGDIIQAMCMALVIRCKIIDYDLEKIENIVNDTLKKAFSDAKKAEVSIPLSGNT
tara:strand:+ start:195 stop:536 length:342 start_codon:yes stop_codon:yes gene_type:complete